MAASTSDKFSSPTTNDRPASATTTAIKADSATSITVDSTTGWETANKVHFTMYEVDANDEKIPSTQRDYEGIVNSATSINNVSIRGGSDREFPIGAKVICAPTAAWADDLVDGILVHANQDGTLKDDAVTTDVIADDAVTTAKIDDDAVTTDKLGGFVEGLEIQSGSTSITPDSADTTKFETVTFGTEFTSTPMVVATATTSSTVRMSVVTDNISTTSVDIGVNRANTTATFVNWIAIAGRD